LFDVIPGRYAAFRRYEAMPILGRDLREADLSNVDGVLVLDTCAYSQLAPIADWLRATSLPKLAVDHHLTRDELADHYVIDESAAATCLILYDWARAVDWAITAEASEALFIGMAMDTGWFRHSNTDDRVLTAAADLVAHGVRPHDLYEQLFQRETPARLRLLGAALGALELSAGDQLGVMTLTTDAIAACGATPADTEDIVNEPLRIGSVVVSVLLVEDGGGIVRASFRSKPPSDRQTEPRASARADSPPVKDSHVERMGAPPPGRAPGASPVTFPSSSKTCRTEIDVAQAARAFGGGGHARAAGARVSGTLSDVRRQIVDHLQRLLSESSS
jgi:phosphoesterase RecJ-like protein